MRTGKRYLAFVLSLILTLSSFAPSVPAYAEDGNPAPSVVFYVSGSDGNMPEDAALRIEGADGKEAPGITVIGGNGTFTAESSDADTETSYRYTASANGYDMSRGTFTFADGSVSVVMNAQAKKAGGVYLKTGSNTHIRLSECMFTDADGIVLSATESEGGWIYIDAPEGTTVNVDVSKNGYSHFAGTLELTKENRTVILPVTAKESAKISAGTLTMEYGDAGTVLDTYVSVAAGYNGQVTYEVTEGTDVVSIVDGLLVARDTGDAEVLVRASETDVFAASEKAFTVHVEKKAIGTLDPALFTWTPEEKVYDGTDTVEAVFTYNDKDHVYDDVLSAEAAVALTTAEAGERTNKRTVRISGESRHYTWNASFAPGDIQIRITKLPVEIAMTDQTVRYGSDSWKSLRDGEKPANWNLNKQVTLLTEGLTEEARANFDALDFNSIAKVILKDNAPESGTHEITKSLGVGTHENALSLLLTKEESRNFRFLVSDKEAASLIVTEEIPFGNGALWAKVAYDEAESAGTYKKGDTIYIRPGGSAAFSSAYELYDSAAVYGDGEASTAGTLSIPNDAKSGSVKGYFYLYNRDDPKTRTDADREVEGAQSNVIPAGSIQVDADYPQVMFAGTGAQDARDTDLQDTLFDSFITGDGKELVVTAKDTMSGLADVRYQIIHMGTADDVKGAVLDRVSDETAWMELPDGGRIQIPSAEDGYNLAAVRASDMVGNTAVYTSNGVVVDTTNPVFQIKGLEDGMVTGSAFAYELEASDPSAVFTGLASITVQILKDGKDAVRVNEAARNADGVYEGAFRAEMEELHEISGEAGGAYTIDELRAYAAEHTLKGSVDPADLADGTYTFHVEAVDLAGNTYSENRTFIVDKEGPSVTASFDNNDAKNSVYFNAVRTLTLNIEDENVDSTSVSFRIASGSKDTDEMARYTLDDLIAGRLPGVTAEKEKEEEGKPFVCHVSFAGRDGLSTTYKYEVEVTDAAGNKESDVAYAEGTAAPDGFVIDRTAPVLKATAASGSDEIHGTEDAPAIIHEPAELSFAVREANFTDGNIDISVTVRNAKGEEIDAFDKAEIEKIKQPSNWEEKDGSNYSYALPAFEKDGAYTLRMSVTDAAGNASDEFLTSFVIDNTAPYGEITVGTDLGIFNTLAEKIRYRIFRNVPVEVTLKAADETSALRGVWYAIYTPEEGEGPEYPAPVTGLEDLAWQKWDEDTVITITPASRAVVYEKIEDMAGNVAYINTEDGVITESDALSVVLSADKGVSRAVAEDVTVSVSVKELTDGGNYSGIKSVSYTVHDGNSRTEEGVLYENTGKKEERADAFEGTLTVHAEKSHTNHITVRVSAEDQAGNKTMEEIHLKIDITSPSIIVSYDNNKPVKGTDSVFTASRKATVLVQDGNVKKEEVLFHIAVDGGEEKAFTYMDLEAGKIPGVTARFVEDTSISYNAESRETPADLLIYELTYGGEGIDHKYRTTITAVDTAGNASDGVTYKAGTASGGEFTIDTVAPKMSIEMTSNGQEFLSGQSRYLPNMTKNSVSAVLKIEERDLVGGTVDLSVKTTNAAGTTISAYPEAALKNANDLTKWEGGNIWSFRMDPFTEDAVYEISGTYTDAAGHKAEMRRTFFVIDKHAPSLSVQVGAGNVFTKLAEKAAFTLFGQDSVSVRITSSDDISKIASTQYCLYEPDKDASGTFTVPAEELDSLPWKTYNGNLSIKADAHTIVYARAEDQAGNVAYVNSEDGLILEKTSPKVTITLPKGTNGIINSDVTMTILAEDPSKGKTYSGLTSLTWNVENGGKTVASGSYNEELKDKTLRKKKIEKTEKLGGISGNDIVLTVIAEDASGNRTEEVRHFAIDTTAPKITLSYDRNDPRNGKYFNSARTLTVSVREQNYSEDDTMFPISIDGEKKDYSVKDLMDGKADGVSAARVSDSEEGKDFAAYTDARTVRYAVTFGGDGKTDHDYEVDVRTKDRAGNVSGQNTLAEGTKAGYAFTIDEVAPDLAVSFAAGGSAAEPSTRRDAPLYIRYALTPSITAKERNFGVQGVSLSVHSYDSKGTETDAYPASSVQEASDGNAWKKEGGAYALAMDPFSKDGNYSFAVSVTDLAGNTASYDPHYFTIDTTPPTGRISIYARDESGSNSSFHDAVRFWFFSKSRITADRTAEDETSGVKSISYYLYTPSADAKGTFGALSRGRMEDLAWQTWNDGVVLSPNRQAVIYGRIEDRAGNVTYINADDGMIADDTAPAEPQITITTSEPRKSVYSGNVNFQIHVEDRISGGTYSGLKSVRYTVSNRGTVTQEGNYDRELGDRTARVLSLTKNETVYADRNNSNHVVIRVTAEDYAGNTVSAEREIKIDTTRPRIEVTYDKNDPANGRYYNGDRTATVRVYERNFDPDAISFSFARNGAPTPVISGWTRSSEAGESDNAVNTCTVTFRSDGDYAFTLEATDLAGNRSEYGRTDEFTIDKTAPEMSVSFEGGSARNGRYYKEGRTAVVTVKEHNFREAEFNAAITAMLNGAGITKPSIGSWSHNGDTHTLRIRFDEDGDYSFDLAYTDLAGNSASPYKESIFTIDKTAPVITFFDVEAEHAYNGEIAPGVRYTDINFDQDAVSITLSGPRHKEEAADGTYTVKNNGGEFVSTDIPHTKDRDDVYTMTAAVTDRAGNRAEEEITFSVNRFGSNFRFGKETESLLDRYYTNAAQDLVIYETNVSDVENKGISIAKDGMLIALEKGRDYTVEEGSSDGWKEYKYTIFAKNFAEEGVYEIRIDTEDAAGNRQDNKLKEAEVRFVVDETPPTVVITGIEEEGRYRDNERTFYVVVADNILADHAEVKVGFDTYTFDRKAIEDAAGRLSVTAKSSSDWQTVKAVVYDAAGNASDEASCTFLLTSSAWIQFIRNRLAVGGVLGGLGAVLAGFFFILFAKKRKKDEEEGKRSTEELEESTSKKTDELKPASSSKTNELNP